ncbi:unnamed protein product [Discosporangium mesarthrocarpum]
MASTLGVLDVLSRLREESERAATALSAQQEKNKAMLERVSKLEETSRQSGAVIQRAKDQKVIREQERQAAEARRDMAEETQSRLEKVTARKAEETRRQKEASRAQAENFVRSCKAFREDAGARVQRLRELKTRFHQKEEELARATEEKESWDEEIRIKKAAREKILSEVSARHEALEMKIVELEEVKHTNQTTLARAQTVEAELSEVQGSQSEIRDLAMGLHKENACLRNELRHLKRKLAADGAPSMPNTSFNEHDDGRTVRRSFGLGTNSVRNRRDGQMLGPKLGGRTPSQQRQGAWSDQQTQKQGGGRYYHSDPMEAQTLGPSIRPLTPQDQHSSGLRQRHIRTSFSTAADMTMPELRLTSPHPGAAEAHEISPRSTSLR